MSLTSQEGAYMAKTYSQLQNICIRKTKDNSPDAVSGFQEDLNIGQEIVASLLGTRARELYTTGTLSLVAGTETYSLNSDVDTIEQVLITSPTNDEKELLLSSKEYERSINPVKSNDSQAMPNRYYLDEPSIAADGTETKVMAFDTIPDQAYTVTYSYKKKVSPMSATVLYPFFNSKYHYILADYAIWQYTERETDESMNPSYWEIKWEKGLALLLETYGSDTKNQEPIPGPVY